MYWTEVSVGISSIHPWLGRYSLACALSTRMKSCVGGPVRYASPSRTPRSPLLRILIVARRWDWKCLRPDWHGPSQWEIPGCWFIGERDQTYGGPSCRCVERWSPPGGPRSVPTQFYGSDEEHSACDYWTLFEAHTMFQKQLIFIGPSSLIFKRNLAWPESKNTLLVTGWEGNISVKLVLWNC